MNSIPNGVELYPRQSDIQSKQELAKQFKIGDVVFAKYLETFSLANRVDAGTALAQRVANKLKRKKDQEELYRMTHAAIVVGVDTVSGRVLVAEAMPTGKGNELRIVDLLSDRSLSLGPDEPYEYHVLRMDEQHAGKLPAHAAEIAQSLANRASYLKKGKRSDFGKGRHSFSFLSALIAIFNDSSKHLESPNHAKRLLKKIADEHLRQRGHTSRATAGLRDRQFWCSHFTAHAFQQAELAQNMHLIEKLEGISDGLTKIEAMPEGAKRNAALRRWSKEMARKHGTKITKMCKKFDTDPKHLAPQALMRHLQRGNLFKPVLTLVPQSKSASRSSVSISA